MRADLSLERGIPFASIACIDVLGREVVIGECTGHAIKKRERRERVATLEIAVSQSVRRLRQETFGPAIEGMEIGEWRLHRDGTIAFKDFITTEQNQTLSG